MGFCAILTLILVVAKIFSLITLSWLLCLAPFLISLAIKLLIVLIAFVILAFWD